jgi:hypothetical protein
VRGDHATLAERLSRLGQPFARHGQARAQGALGVQTHALGIGHGDQEARARTGRMAALIHHVRTDQALIHPTALAGHASEWRGREGGVVPEGDLRCEAMPLRAYRVPMVAGVGRWRRCPRGTHVRFNAREGPLTQRVT